MTPGQVIDVEVAYNGGTSWRAEIYWNGAWRTLYTQDLGVIYFNNASQIGETYTANGWHVPVGPTNFYDSTVYSSGAWRQWTPSLGHTDEFSDFPYCAKDHWTAKYWDWYMHKHNSGSTCL